MTTITNDKNINNKKTTNKKIHKNTNKIYELEKYTISCEVSPKNSYKNL